MKRSTSIVPAPGLWGLMGQWPSRPLFRKTSPPAAMASRALAVALKSTSWDSRYCTILDMPSPWWPVLLLLLPPP